jgi:hypothetical protein
VTGGRKKGTENRDKPFKDALRKALARNNWRDLDQIAEGLIQDAIKGDSFARQQIADRLDGKPAQETEGQVGGDVTLIVKWPKSGQESTAKTLSRKRHEREKWRAVPADGGFGPPATRSSSNIHRNIGACRRTRRSTRPGQCTGRRS